MSGIKSAKKILSELFAGDGNIEVICSLHEKELTVSEISEITSADPDNLNFFLNELLENNIVRRRIIHGEEHFTITDTKICDSLLMLKDTIYKLSHDRGNH